MEKLLVPQKYIPNENETSIYVSRGKEYCIVRKDKNIYAIDNTCPHQGASLGLGEMNGDEIICPLHQWRFNFKTGACSVERFCIERYQVEIIDK